MSASSETVRPNAPRGAALVWLLLAVVACGGDQSPGASPGEEKASCYANGSCNVGLTCFSNKCVRYENPDGSDSGAAAGVGGSDSGAAGSPGSLVEGGPSGAGGGETGRDASSTAGASGLSDAMASEGSSGFADTKDAAGPIGDASKQDVAVDSAGGPDTLTVPDCGQIGIPTRDTYSGVVTITVSGIVQGSPGSLHDPFYFLSPGDNSMTSGACRDCLVYDHFAEGSCLCGSGVCAASHRVSDALVGAYPTFSASHSYTVQMDLGQSSQERINFAFYDCGCDDNAGSYMLTVAR